VTGGILTGTALTVPVAVSDGYYEMFVRPSAFVMDEMGVYKASVKEINFRGIDTLITFSGEDGICWKRAFVRPPELQIGQKIAVRLCPDDAVLFPM